MRAHNTRSEAVFQQGNSLQVQYRDVQGTMLGDMTISYRRKSFGDMMHVAVTSDRDLVDPHTGEAGRPYGYVGVTRPREAPNFANQAVQQWTEHPLHGPRLVQTGSAVEETGAHDPEFWKGGGPAPTEMFTHTPASVHLAFTDPTLRHHVPTMIGIAVNAVGGAHDDVMADDTLSPYSSRLARKASKRGMGVVGHPGNKTMDSWGAKERMERMLSSETPEQRTEYFGPELGASEVAAGKALVRSRIRPRSQTQFPPPQTARQEMPGQGKLDL